MTKISAFIKHNKFNTMSRCDGSYDISLHIIHSNLRFVREKPNAKRGEVDFCIQFVFPVQNEGWHVETSPHSTHPCLTRAQICISQPGYTGACIRVLAQHWLSVTVQLVLVVPVGTCLGTRAILESTF